MTIYKVINPEPTLEDSTAEADAFRIMSEHFHRCAEQFRVLAETASKHPVTSYSTADGELWLEMEDEAAEALVLQGVLNKVSPEELQEEFSEPDPVLDATQNGVEAAFRSALQD